MTADGHPVSYPGRGSHASYFAAGLYETEGWFDIVDGRREAPPLQLVVPEEDGGEWIHWPGAWGDTKASILPGLEEPSPTGPGQHRQWREPDSLFTKSVVRTAQKPAQPPELDATRQHDELWVKLELAGHDLGGTPLKLLATINSHDEKGVPPKTFTFDIANQGDSGQFNTGVRLDAHHRYEVDLSVIVLKDNAEVPTASRCCPIEPGVESKIPEWVKHPIWAIEQFVAGLR
jgi:hypothetical protein